jgi:hypothetical protein
MKKSIWFLFLLVPALLCAQIADEIEILLETNAVTYGQAARITLEAAGVLTTDDQSEAFDYAVQQEWLPANVNSWDFARLDQISLLLMRSFNMRGGINYSVFQTAHFAYRELRYRDVIQGRAAASMLVSGESLLFYINRMIVLQER